ncbi:MAG: S41 family peptidase [Chloroflexota bacterium]
MPPFAFRRRAGVLVLALLLVCPLLPAPAQAASEDGVHTITGEVTVTSPFIGRSFSEPFMMLTDLTAFVERDLLMPLPTPSQIMAVLEGNFREGASFAISLPIAPRGNPVMLPGNAAGVQIYTVDFQVNIAGDPALTPQELVGWPTAITSVRVELGTNEVTGGQLVAWSPDASQQFPAGFGPDGKLFTADDPMSALPAGWTVVDLNAEPFARIREAVVDVPIIEGDVAVKDLSTLGYAAAFDALVAELELRYPFTEFKGIDWDALSAKHRPVIAAAEQADDPAAYHEALFAFAAELGDGHVSVDPPERLIVERIGGGTGLAVGRTDDGAIVVRCVAGVGSAGKSGILPGAEIIRWDGKPAAEALEAIAPLFGESTEDGALRQRLMLFPRTALGKRVEVVYRNPGGDEATTTLKGAKEIGSVTDPCANGQDQGFEMPVTATILPGGIGYIKVTSFSEDFSLMTHAWDWAIREFRAKEVSAVVVDLRDNGGGLTRIPLYMAGSFVEEPFVLARQIYIDENGAPQVTAIDQVLPGPAQWRKPVAVLVGPDCVSACELFAAAIAESPNAIVVGLGPTAGVEGGVFPWKMPEDIGFRAPLIGFEDEDGNVYLEGVGVPPDILVPSTAETLRTDPGAPDAVLAAAVDALGSETPEREPAAATPIG